MRKIVGGSDYSQNGQGGGMGSKSLRTPELKDVDCNIP